MPLKASFHECIPKFHKSFSFESDSEQQSNGLIMEICCLCECSFIVPPMSIKLSPGGCCHGGRAERRVSHHHLEEREEKGGGWGLNEGLIGATFDPDMSMSRSGHLRKPADLWLFSRRLSFCCQQHVGLNTSLPQK